MNLKTPIHYSCHPNFGTVNKKFIRNAIVPKHALRSLALKNNLISVFNCISPSHEVAGIIAQIPPIEEEKEENIAVIKEAHLSEENAENNGKELSENESLWSQILEIAKFSGPAVGLWICGPLMSLIDTVVIGQGSSIELAALGSITMLILLFIYFSVFCLVD